MQPDRVLYTAHASATGGRQGLARSDDGALDVTLSTPKALGGAGGAGTNPEQLFAAGYSACFLGAMNVVAGQQKVKLPADTQVTGHVGIGPCSGGFAIAVALEIHIPHMEHAAAVDLVTRAHQVCPYSNATRGNVDVQLTVI
jgi:osmotically inducible protein OsmC